MYRSPITITAAQRQPIYELVADRLAGIGAVHICLQSSMYAEAENRGREFAEDIRLLQDIGWDRNDLRESFELTIPPEDLMEHLKRLVADAAAGIKGPAAESREVRLDDETRDRYGRAEEVCGELLSQLDPRGGEAA